MQSFRAFAAALCVTALLAAPALTHEITVGALELTDLWTRATPPSAPTAAGFVTITNTGTEADRLIAVTSPFAEKAELHVSAVKDGIMSMRPAADGIAILPGETVTLAPGESHIMFIKLKEPLKEGDKMPVTLTFDKGGRVETFLHVLAIGADGPEGSAPAAHDGH